MASKFESSILHNIISSNNTAEFDKFLTNNNSNDPYRVLSTRGETYLHLAVEKHCHLDIIKQLIPRVRLGQRNEVAKTAFELATEKGGHPSGYQIAQFHQEFILYCLKNGTYPVIEELVLDGWRHWPVKGVPEIENFKEAPMYLSASFGRLSFLGGPNLLSRKQLLAVMSKAEKKEEEHNQVLRKWRDLLGMSLLHLAVLYKEQSASSNLLKRLPELLQAQDNMGRTPLHYACSYNEGSEIRIQMDLACKDRKEVYNIVDETGHTCTDYAEKKEKLDTKKVVNLLTFLMRSVEQDTFVQMIMYEKSYYSAFFPDMAEGVGMRQMLFNCNGDPFIDGTGRNLLHKLVIFSSVSGDKFDFEKKFVEITKVDSAGKMYKGQDIWGRTPLHYAYMLNRPAINTLQKKRFNVPQSLITDVKAMKDHEGKTVDDYHMPEKEAYELSVNLTTTIMIVTMMGQVRICQSSIMKQLLKPARAIDKSSDMFNSDSDTSSEDDDDDDEDQAMDEESAAKELFEDEIWNIFKEYEENSDFFEYLLKLIASVKMLNGIPLLFYAHVLKNEHYLELFHEIEGYETIEDHMGRNTCHYECFTCKEDGDDYLKDFNEKDFESSNDFVEFSPQPKAIGVNIGRPHPLLRTDLLGKKPYDYNKKDVDLFPSDIVLQNLAEFSETPISTSIKRINAVNPKSSRKSTRATEQSNNKQHKGPQTSRPKYSTSSAISKAVDTGPPLDSEYLKKSLGVALTSALSAVSQKQPADPIEYLAQYLYKVAENQRRQDATKELAEQLAIEMKKAEKSREREELMQLETDQLVSQQRQQAVKLSDGVLEEENE